MKIEDLKIVRSKRKSILLAIEKDFTVYVKAPLHYTDKQILDFVNSKAQWIENHMAKLREMEAQERSNPIPRLSSEDIKQLAEEAIKYIPERVRCYAAILGVTYGRITIRNQTTRWGSCSGKGNLNFNCLLMLMPKEMIDYTVVHELCHLIELNHSKNFYKLLGSVLPDYKEREKWYKDNGWRIMKMMTG